MGEFTVLLISGVAVVYNDIADILNQHACSAWTLANQGPGKYQNLSICSWLLDLNLDSYRLEIWHDGFQAQCSACHRTNFFKGPKIRELRYTHFLCAYYGTVIGILIGSFRSKSKKWSDRSTEQIPIKISRYRLWKSVENWWFRSALNKETHSPSWQ